MNPSRLVNPEMVAGRQPVSANGHIMLANALNQLGRIEEVREQVRKSWKNVNFGRDQQKNSIHAMKNT